MEGGELSPKGCINTASDGFVLAGARWIGPLGPQHQHLSKVRKQRHRAREGLIQGRSPGAAVLGSELCTRELEILAPRRGALLPEPLRIWGAAERKGGVKRDGAGVQSKRE